MFTGIIAGVGTLTERDTQAGDTPGDARLVIDTRATGIGSIGLGDSIAVNGVCLTATACDADGFSADVSAETLALTTLGDLRPGSRVNLESALRAGQPLGGHLVSGHVDGLGRLQACTSDARSWRLMFTVPPGLMRFLAPKGSVCVDGISLTVNEVESQRFGVNIVPYTMAHTTLGDRREGDAVNLEIDLVARYLARLLAAGTPANQ